MKFEGGNHGICKAFGLSTARTLLGRTELKSLLFRLGKTFDWSPFTGWDELSEEEMGDLLATLHSTALHCETCDDTTAKATRAGLENNDEERTWSTIDDVSRSIRLFLATMAIVWGMDGVAIKEMQKLFRPILSELSNINDYMEEDKHIGKKKVYRFTLSKLYMEDVKATWNALFNNASMETEEEEV